MTTSPSVTSPNATVDWQPFLIEPIFVPRVWGFHDLRPWFEMPTQAASDGTQPAQQRVQPIGEVWLTGDACSAASGPHRGESLAHLFAAHPLAMLGQAAAEAASPLLIKLIFAREKLSVQVHPDDEMARSLGQPRGKTECWYALTADPGAQVACGLRPGTTLDEIRAAIPAQTLESLLNVLPVHTGEMVFVDAGTVHAIWPGSVLLETQQNSDTTFRLYDYGRPRELHIDQSLAALRLETSAGIVPPEPLPTANGSSPSPLIRVRLVRCDSFTVERLSLTTATSSRALADGAKDQPTLSYLFAVSGRAEITGNFPSVELAPMSIMAIPAAAPEFTVTPAGETCEIIRITAPPY